MLDSGWGSSRMRMRPKLQRGPVVLSLAWMKDLSVSAQGVTTLPRAAYSLSSLDRLLGSGYPGARRLRCAKNPNAATRTATAANVHGDCVGIGAAVKAPFEAPMTRLSTPNGWEPAPLPVHVT